MLARAWDLDVRGSCDSAVLIVDEEDVRLVNVECSSRTIRTATLVLDWRNTSVDDNVV